jgi:phosphatidylglycerol---prolipoprotein diacylglyceryl transferase
MLTLAQFYHDFQSTAFTLGPLNVRWYGLSYIASFFIAFALLRWLSKRGSTPIPAHRAADAMLIVGLGTIFGGRLGYALVYEPHLFVGFRNAFPYWDLFALQKGGMASHGGMVGIAIACWIVSRGFKYDEPALAGQREGKSSLAHVSDVMCLLAPIGLFLGRCANFINGELLGKVVAMPGMPAPWWAVRFPQELAGWRGPTQREGHAVELSAEQLSRLQSLVASRALPTDRWSDVIANILAKAGQLRPQLEPLLSARHPSQLYQAFAEGIVLMVVVWTVAAKKRTPGIVTGYWLITYGALRVVTEFWRLPDADLAIQRPWGLSRGQWLSVIMVIVGIAVLFIVRKSKRAPLLGWATKGSPIQD